MGSPVACLRTRLHADQCEENFVRHSSARKRERDQCDSSRAKWIAILMSISTGLASCASPVFLSGEGLPEEERSEFQAGHGIEFVRVDGDEVGARWLIMEPGTYTIEFKSKRDVKTVNVALEGVVDELECTIKVEVLAGEDVYVSSRLKTGSSRFSGGYSTSGFHTEASISSSLEGRSRSVDTSQCDHRIDCRKVNRSRAMPPNCD